MRQIIINLVVLVVVHCVWRGYFYYLFYCKQIDNSYAAAAHGGSFSLLCRLSEQTGGNGGKFPTSLKISSHIAPYTPFNQIHFQIKF
jgi:hypothetical protein